MELWIRSQNKLTITKINSIVIDYNNRKSIIANYEDFNGNENYTPLGEYDTEERALEVLDEIQHKLITLCDSMNRHLYVYEMPQE